MLATPRLAGARLPKEPSAIVFRDTAHAAELAAAQGIRSADLLKSGDCRHHRAGYPTPQTESRSSSPDFVERHRRRSARYEYRPRNASRLGCNATAGPGCPRPRAPAGRHKSLKSAVLVTLCLLIAAPPLPHCWTVIRQNGRHGHWCGLTSGVGRRDDSDVLASLERGLRLSDSR